MAPMLGIRNCGQIFTLREATGTAMWAHHVDDEPFECEGHRLIADALTLFWQRIRCRARAGRDVETL